MFGPIIDINGFEGYHQVGCEWHIGCDRTQNIFFNAIATEQ
jgi:hypothetical protein